MFCAWEKLTACGHNSWCLLERTAGLFVMALKTSFCLWFLIRTPWKCVTETFYSWLFFSFLNPVLHMLVICEHGGVLLSWKINDGDIKLMALANSTVYICEWQGKGRQGTESLLKCLWKFPILTEIPPVSYGLYHFAWSVLLPSTNSSFTFKGEWVQGRGSLPIWRKDSCKMSSEESKWWWWCW